MKFKKGLTLIEALIGIFIFSLIMLLLSSLVVWLIRSNIRIQIETEVLENTQAAIQRIIYEIREADSIYYPTSNSTQLSLQTDLYLPEDESYTYIDFFMCEDRLCFKQEGESPMAITSEKVRVNNLNFSYLGTTTPSVQVVLEADYNAPADKDQYQYSVKLISTANLRSY